MNAFQQQIGRYQYLFVSVFQNGCIIADSFSGTFILYLYIFRQMPD
jgi:hypothetical protein